MWCSRKDRISPLRSCSRRPRLEAKREHNPLPEAPEPEAQPGKVLDLMATLRESVDKAKASRGAASVHELPRKKTAAKAATKKQPAAKKTTAKKTTQKAAAKKRTPRRSA